MGVHVTIEIDHRGWSWYVEDGERFVSADAWVTNDTGGFKLVKPDKDELENIVPGLYDAVVKGSLYAATAALKRKEGINNDSLPQHEQCPGH
jgi:hypothetical protein